VRHPEFLLVPVLMISDYLLTIAGARLRADVYGRHFRTQHYELNPAWQSAVAKLRWFNPRHLLITFAFTVFLSACIEALGPREQPFVDAIEGFLLGVFGAVNGRHLGNLATFMYLKRHPESISGSVTMNHELVLWISTVQGLAFLVPSALLALYSPTSIVLGFAAGALMLIILHLGWIRRLRSRTRPSAAADAQATTPDSASIPASVASGTNLPCASSSANTPPSRTSSS
jgi:hypothetical protein